MSSSGDLRRALTPTEGHFHGHLPIAGRMSYILYVNLWRIYFCVYLFYMTLMDYLVDVYFVDALLRRARETFMYHRLTHSSVCAYLHSTTNEADLNFELRNDKGVLVVLVVRSVCLSAGS